MKHARSLGLAGLLIVPALPAHAVRYLVRVKDGAGNQNLSLRREVRSANRVALARELRILSGSEEALVSLPRTGFVVFDSPDEASAEAALIDHPLVEYFERDIRWQTFSSDDGTAPSSQSKSPWLEDVIGLDEEAPASDVTYDGDAPVLVAVIDTGVNLAHPYLQSALAANSAEGNGNTSSATSDHGTHVAGLVKTIRDQAIPRFPQAKAVQILPVRFIDESGVGSTAAAIEGLEYAASRGARVVNASWGARGQEAFSRALYETMVELYNRDIVITVAAGNAERGGPNNNDVIPYFPANFSIPSLISVASVTPTYELGDGTTRVFKNAPLSDFSNYGKGTVDIAAPGSFTDIWGDSAGLYSANGRFTSASNAYIRKRGTSMSSPLIAGVAAVVRAINPQLTAFEVKKVLNDTVTRQSGLPVKTQGVVNAAAAFSVAAGASTGGDHGQLSDSPYSQTKTTPTELRDVGGCASIQGGGSGDGPLGGNSMGLLSLAFVVLALARQTRRKNSFADSAINPECSTRS